MMNPQIIMLFLVILRSLIICNMKWLYLTSM